MVTEVFSPPPSQSEGRVALDVCRRKGRTLQLMEVAIPPSRSSSHQLADANYGACPRMYDRIRDSVIEHLAYHPEWPEVADTVIEATQQTLLLGPVAVSLWLGHLPTAFPSE